MLGRWDPFAEMSRLQDEMWKQHGESRRGFTPAVDIYEDKEGFSIRAELPGVKAEDVHVTVENQVLTLRGERKLEKEDKREGYHRVERSYGAFTRSFVLPNTVAGDNVQAEMKDGVLTLKLMKKPETQPRRIEVKTS